MSFRKLESLLEVPSKAFVETLEIIITNSTGLLNSIYSLRKEVREHRLIYPNKINIKADNTIKFYI